MDSLMGKLDTVLTHKAMNILGSEGLEKERLSVGKALNYGPNKLSDKDKDRIQSAYNYLFLCNHLCMIKAISTFSLVKDSRLQ